MPDPKIIPKLSILYRIYPCISPLCIRPPPLYKPTLQKTAVLLININIFLRHLRSRNIVQNSTEHWIKIMQRSGLFLEWRQMEPSQKKPLGVKSHSTVDITLVTLNVRVEDVFRQKEGVWTSLLYRKYNINI